MNTISDNRKRTLTRVDCIAIPIIAATILYQFFFVFRGINIIDESFYLSIAHRLTQGDRMLVDDWHVSQLSAVFQLLPFHLFYTLTGSTDGCILFFRLLYVTVHSAVSVYLYTQLRKYGYVSILATVLFCHYELIIPTISYYTVSMMCTVILALCFIIKDHVKPSGLVFTGVIMAFLVLSEPVFAIVYFIWAVVVIVRSLRGYSGFHTSFRTFLWITGGIAAVALCFFIWFFSKESFREFIETIPNMFTDSEYVFTFGSERSGNVFGFNALFSLIKRMGWYYFAGYAVLSSIALIDKKRADHVLVYLLSGTVLFAANTVTAVMKATDSDIMFLFHRNIPLAFYGIVCFILLKKRDSRLLRFWSVGMVYSLIIDISSEKASLIGAPISALPGCVIVWKLWSEQLEKLKAESSVKRRSQAKQKKIFSLRIACILLVLSVILSATPEIASFPLENRRLVFERFYRQDLEPLAIDTRLERGPLRGIYTDAAVQKQYYDILDDLDIIRQQKKAPVYIYGRLSWAYLYLDLPYATYSTWYVEEDSRTRQETYYRLHPEKIPGYIYIPSVTDTGFSDCEEKNADRLQYLKTRFDCTVEKGRAGYIVKVNKALF